MADIGFSEYTPPGGPTVTTQAVSSIGSAIATGNGNITDVGSGNCTARGVQVNTSATINGVTEFEEEGTFGTGAFTASITGLASGTTYYVRAYATNASGSGYGEWVSFTTDEDEENLLENGDIIYLENGDSVESDTLVEEGGTLRQDQDDDEITITGDIVNYGTLGHSGCDATKVTVTGTIINHGTNYWSDEEESDYLDNINTLDRNNLLDGV